MPRQRLGVRGGCALKVRGLAYVTNKRKHPCRLALSPARASRGLSVSCSTAGGAAWPWRASVRSIWQQLQKRAAARRLRHTAGNARWPGRRRQCQCCSSRVDCSRGGNPRCAQLRGIYLPSACAGRRRWRRRCNAGTRNARRLAARHSLPALSPAGGSQTSEYFGLRSADARYRPPEAGVSCWSGHWSASRRRRCCILVTAPARTPLLSLQLFKQRRHLRQRTQQLALVCARKSAGFMSCLFTRRVPLRCSVLSCPRLAATQ